MAQMHEKWSMGPRGRAIPSPPHGPDSIVRSKSGARVATHSVPEGDVGIEAPAAVWGSDRRMHIRAIGLWRQAAGGKALPSIADFPDEAQSEYADNTFLLSLRQGERPRPVFIGKALRALQSASGESGESVSPPTDPCAMAEALSRFPQAWFPDALRQQVDRLLARLLTERGPVPFESEFTGEADRVFLSRGVLLPFTGAGGGIDYVLGVIRWREVADESVAAAIVDEVNVADQRVMQSQGATSLAPGAKSAETRGAAIAMLAHLARARASARLIPSGDIRGRAALYRALGFAYDFALATEAGPEGYQALLTEAGIRAQARSPMTAIVKLVFGPDYDKTRIAEFSAAMGYARRHDLPGGGMALFLEHFPGGLKGVVLAERQHRGPGRGTRAHKPGRKGAGDARNLPTGPTFALRGEDEFAVVLVRRIDHDTVGVIGAFPGGDALVAAALKAVGDRHAKQTDGASAAPAEGA